MMQLLVFKERIREIYRKFRVYINPAAKFFVAYLVLFLLNNQMGYEDKLMKFPVLLLASAVAAFTPSAVFVFIAAVFVVLHVFAASKILSLIILLIILILYLLFARFAPNYGWVVLALPILYYLKIPYLIPVLLGLIATPITIMPTVCGIVIFYLLQLIKEAAVTAANTGVEDSLQLYTYVLKNLIDNKMMFLTIAVFFCVIAITFLVRKLKIEHAFDIAIIAGVLSNILLFLMGDLMLGVSDRIFPMIMGTLGAGIVVFVIQFFRFTLDYSTVESVQFEDDDYYYYVKAVPKMKITTPEINIKKFSSTADKEVLEEDSDYFDGEEEVFAKKGFEEPDEREDWERDQPRRK